MGLHESMSDIVSECFQGFLFSSNLQNIHRDVSLFVAVHMTFWFYNYKLVLVLNFKSLSSITSFVIKSVTFAIKSTFVMKFVTYFCNQVSNFL